MTKLNLFVDAISIAPVDFDFGQGYGETWEMVMPDVDSWGLRKCSAYLEDEGYTGDAPDVNPFSMGREEMAELLNEAGIEVYDDEDDETLREAVVANMDDGTIDGIDEWREAVRENMQDTDDFAPMMNYYYPLPRLRMTAEEAQAKIMGAGACVVVLVNDEPVLALAGGGMDLSPDICRAYVALGYFPPMHFASNLPRLGTAYGIEPALIDACLEGARIAQRWATNAVEDLERFAAQVAAKQSA